MSITYVSKHEDIIFVSCITPNYGNSKVLKKLKEI